MMRHWRIGFWPGSIAARGGSDGRTRSTSRRNRSCSGFTLIELTIAMAILLISILGFSRSILSIGSSSQKHSELARATNSAREMLERVSAESFPQAFRSFNASSADDPGGANTAPGAGFAVDGLSALPGDADHMPGEVIFPSPSGSPGQLREDLVMPELGMPRDLNGDGIIDGADHALDYKILPVLVRLRWRTASGTGSFEVKTMLAGF